MRKKLTLEQMQAIAKSRGGKCISNKYEGCNLKLKWECSDGHRWEATPSNIKSGTWCTRCVYKKKMLTIEDMQEIARSRGGKCISEKYLGCVTKLEWECAKGHRWKSKPTNVKNDDAWCHVCSGTKKLTIEEMQTIAKSNGGWVITAGFLSNSSRYP